MKQLVIAASLVALISGAAIAKKEAPVAGPAKSSLVAAVNLSEDGDRLWAKIEISGVESGKTVAPVVRWTAPEKAVLFRSTEWTSRPVRNRTKSYRTLVTDVEGKSYRAVGVWKVTVLVDGVEIGQATYEVK